MADGQGRTLGSGPIPGDPLGYFFMTFSSQEALAVMVGAFLLSNFGV